MCFFCYSKCLKLLHSLAPERVCSLFSALQAPLTWPGSFPLARSVASLARLGTVYRPPSHQQVTRASHPWSHAPEWLLTGTLTQKLFPLPDIGSFPLLHKILFSLPLLEAEDTKMCRGLPVAKKTSLGSLFVLFCFVNNQRSILVLLGLLVTPTKCQC